MAEFGFKMTGKWKELGVRLNPNRMTARLKTYMRQATTFNGLLMEREIKKKIGGPGTGWPPLSSLTKEIKGSSGFLFDKGNLLKAITTKTVNYKTAFVGVLQQAKGVGGKSMVNIVYALHEGASVQVTEKMRQFFWALWAAKKGILTEDKLWGRAKEVWARTRGRVNFRKLSESTRVIRIPGRPFIREVFEDPRLWARLKQNWETAIDRALK